MGTSAKRIIGVSFATVTPSRKARIGYEGRVVLLALLAGLPGAAVALIILWTGHYAARTQWTLSVIIWRTSRLRCAPNAVRIAISLDRVVARTSTRLATFTHASSNTRPASATTASTILTAREETPCLVCNRLGICCSKGRAVTASS